MTPNRDLPAWSGFNDRAVAQVNDMTFRPATRGGAAVASWYIIVMQPQR